MGLWDTPPSPDELKGDPWATPPKPEELKRSGSTGLVGKAVDLFVKPHLNANLQVGKTIGDVLYGLRPGQYLKAPEAPQRNPEEQDPDYARRVARSDFKEMGTPDSFMASAGYVVPGAQGQGNRLLEGVRLRAEEGVARAENKGLDLATKKVEKNVNSLRGTYGGNRSGESAAIDAIDRALADPNLSPATRQRLQTIKASPDWTNVVENVAKNYGDDFGGMVKTTDAAKAAYEQAASTAKSDIAAEQTRVLSVDEAKAQLAARLKRYGPMGVAGALLGSPLGVPGALVGAGAGAAVRPMLHALRRAYQHPSVQRGVWSPVESAAGAIGAAAERIGLTGGAAGAEARAAALAQALRQRLVPTVAVPEDGQ